MGRRQCLYYSTVTVDNNCFVNCNVRHAETRFVISLSWHSPRRDVDGETSPSIYQTWSRLGIRWHADIEAWNREIDPDINIASNANRIVYTNATARDALRLHPLMHVRGRLTTARMSESGALVQSRKWQSAYVASASWSNYGEFLLLIPFVLNKRGKTNEIPSNACFAKTST